MKSYKRQFLYQAIDKILEMDEVRSELGQDNWKGGSGAPLHLAAALGRTEIMERLIRQGCKVNRSVRHALII